jgi:hypothetical protein
LGKDEMEIITEDKWDEDIWGIEHEDATGMVEIPKLIFYFGADVSRLRHSEFQLLLTDIQGLLGCKPYPRCPDSCKRKEGRKIII